MKRLQLFPIMLLVFFIMTGCTQINLNRTEIDRIFNTRIIAVDKTGPDKILFTISTKTGSTGGGSEQANPKKSEILASEGTTVFEAARTMMDYANKKPHYGHTEFIIFGEETARGGILPYLDFISRNHEFRYNAKIYIVMGNSGSSILNDINQTDMYLADKLAMLEENTNALSNSSKVTLSEAMYIFDKEKVSTFLPCLEITRALPGEAQSQGSYELLMKGYCVFKGDKLIDFLDDRLSRGVNWIKNRIKSGIILVEAPDSKKVSLEIIQSRTTIKPFMDENGLQCTISIKFNSNIAESLTKEDVFNKAGLEYLKKQQERVIKKEVEDVLKYAQENEVDIFGIVSSFIIKYPMSKNELSDNWQKLFPTIQFDIEVHSNINRTYLLRQPTGSKAKD